jgi:uncharacterized protein (TIGR02145 family)
MKKQADSLQKFSRMGLVLTGSMLAILAACGDDSGSGAGNPREKVEVVSSIYNLGDCTDDMEGDTVFVKDKKTDYVCQDGEWNPVEDNESQSSSSKKSDKVSSSSGAKEKTGSSSSAKGDSSSSKKDDASNSSVAADSLRSSSSVAKDTSENKENVAIKDKSISGVSQKGPFVNGSSVTVQELDGKTLVQTGKSFKGKISNDKGEFAISSVTLASQYAILEASGYYRKETSGNKSSGTITLNALTDLSDRKKVNINLLTHLEYERALYLVGTGLSVEKAKKQAEMEIFKAFGIEGDFANSEDLDIFSEGDENAALLAISVLMLGNRSEADLTELLTNFATDIEKDGKWDDDATKTKIADWAASADLSGEQANIRKYIQGWNLGDVPDFEKYIRNFWYANYGLGACSDNRKGEVLAAQNEKSTKYNTRERYICKSGAWVVASDIEKDTYEWTNGKIGEIKKGDVSDTYYAYDGINWIAVSDREVTIGLCTQERNDEIEKYDDIYFICRTNEWIVASTLEYDTYEMKCTEDGTIVNGRINLTNNYVCDADTFRAATNLEVVLKKGCVSYVLGSEYKPIGQLSYYRCEQTGKWFFDKEKNLGTMTDSRDEKTYRTTTIGTQVWMAENLNYEKYGSLCYENEPDNCTKYGRLYDWHSAQNACPPNWHLPDTTEWNALFTSIGGKSNAGIVLKSTNGWTSEGWATENGIDSYGFTMLLTGYYWESKFTTNSYDYFWTSTEEIPYENGVGGRIILLGNSASEGWNHYEFACNIRCVKD